MMTIGEVAARGGVPTPTVRYYERRGLIEAPQRTKAGYRQYSSKTAERLRFIKRAQGLGFTLDEIRELLELRVEDSASCLVVETRARDKIAQVREKIRDLRRMETVLEQLADSCRTREPTAECPMLETLIQEDTG